MVLSKKGYSEREISLKICCSKTAAHTAISIVMGVIKT